MAQDWPDHHKPGSAQSIDDELSASARELQFGKPG